MASFKSGPAICIKGVGLNKGQGPSAIQLPQVPFVKARFGSARFAWNRAADTAAFGGTTNIWLIEDEKERGGKKSRVVWAGRGLRVGGGLRASAVVSNVSRVVDGLRDPGDATSFHFAYTLDAQAYVKPTDGTVLRGKVSYARPFAKARLIEQEPHILTEQVQGASLFRMKAELEGAGGSALGVQLTRSVQPAGGLMGVVFIPRPLESTEVYGK
ncbi:ubiquinol-cytochrome c reductase iron-sulfur subunit [Chlorella sorokiniana]|uniref:Ubiquinol-cytochrome c reductase iron-sulfur subunit n=1 Tax=Chlorella sorokiniana TaxID=3076 RepID=A0A2P6TUW7_CHLSO|nr:ubiquinol-cytochrome c reductase iron-sulfur subunit [Chlorella sorokiniana]|eukprot:PRW57836.1 ubiquinol-cytochrome c reductase iron-sulfur subunit [Chlorella sorokiniana]